MLLQIIILLGIYTLRLQIPIRVVNKLYCGHPSKIKILKYQLELKIHHHNNLNGP